MLSSSQLGQAMASGSGAMANCLGRSQFGDGCRKPHTGLPDVKELPALKDVTVDSLRQKKAPEGAKRELILAT